MGGGVATMIAVQLRWAFQAPGAELAVAGDRLRFRPVDAVTADERETLHAYKTEVLAILGSQCPRQPIPPVPALDAAIAFRVAAFRDQLSAWTASGRPAVPLLVAWRSRDRIGPVHRMR